LRFPTTARKLSTKDIVGRLKAHFSTGGRKFHSQQELTCKQHAWLQYSAMQSCTYLMRLTCTYPNHRLNMHFEARCSGACGSCGSRTCEDGWNGRYTACRGAEAPKDTLGLATADQHVQSRLMLSNFNRILGAGLWLFGPWNI